MNWQPISTVPLDGPVMLTDGLIFGAGKRNSYIEPAELGYSNPPMFGGDTRRPNPDAGKVHYYWVALGGWSIWDKDTEWEDGEYEQRSPRLIEPTHWAPMPSLPRGDKP